MRAMQKPESASLVSPLSGSSNIEPVQSYDVTSLVSEWKAVFDIDISAELKGVSEIHKYRCRDSDLYFYSPEECEGSGGVYNDLAKFDWYYMAEKWEYSVARKFALPGIRLLEIGCGDGSFLRKACKNGTFSVGLEINPKVTSNPEKDGFEIRHEMTDEYLLSNPAPFDVVCAFQVLEHIAKPLPFLRESLQMLKPGGKLVLGTPNSESFMKHEHVLLDLPPHHMSGWSENSYRYLERCLPVTLESIQFEPLAPYHVDYFMNTYRKHYEAAGNTRSFLFKGSTGNLTGKFLNAGGRRFFKGQSMLAVFTKN